MMEAVSWLPVNGASRGSVYAGCRVGTSTWFPGSGSGAGCSKLSTSLFLQATLLGAQGACCLPSACRLDPRVILCSHLASLAFGKEA